MLEISICTQSTFGYATINTSHKVDLLINNRTKEGNAMKRVTLEATDENVLKSIQDQKGTTRNAEILEFIEALEQIEGNMFISLDARWGEGKTFYVRQIEMTLEYLTLMYFGSEDTRDKYEEMDPYFDGVATKDMVLDNSYLPVYYNAWLYDNHSDPLMSLLSVIIKRRGEVFDTKLSDRSGSKIKKLLSDIQINVGLPWKGINVSTNGDSIAKAIESKDIFEEIQLAEDIREKVKELLKEVLVEYANKLVIFIDELDRCKPSYALEMLERIKHYFDDDNIIFVVSVNKEQLTHTISNYYGNGFDSTGYLNKFFDINISVPPIKRKNEKMHSIYSERRFFEMMIKTLSTYYRLSLRDVLIYEEKMAVIDAAETNNLISDEDIGGICASIFIPLIVVLDMKDVHEKNRFLNGESDILEKIEKLNEVANIYKSLGYRAEEESRLTKGKKMVEAVYGYAFQNDTGALGRAELAVGDIGRNFKELCIKISGVIKDNR